MNLEYNSVGLHQVGVRTEGTPKVPPRRLVLWDMHIHHGEKGWISGGNVEVLALCIMHNRLV